MQEASAVELALERALHAATKGALAKRGLKAILRDAQVAIAACRAQRLGWAFIAKRLDAARGARGVKDTIGVATVRGLWRDLLREEAAATQHGGSTVGRAAALGHAAPHECEPSTAQLVPGIDSPAARHAPRVPRRERDTGAGQEAAECFSAEMVQDATPPLEAGAAASDATLADSSSSPARVPDIGACDDEPGARGAQAILARRQNRMRQIRPRKNRVSPI